MYLLDTQQLIDLFSKRQDRPIFVWLSNARPGRHDLFASVVSLGILAHGIERLAPPERSNWRRLFQEGRRQFEGQGGIVDVDYAVIDDWQRALRGAAFIPPEGKAVGEDQRLVYATAIARGLTLVTAASPVIDQLTRDTALTAVFV